VYLNNDRMLAYFDTSAHDNQSLREVHGRTPTPEFLAWALERGIFRQTADGTVVRGPHWGNARRFCDSDGEFADLVRATPALYGFENAGSRPTNAVSRRLRSNQALARQAIIRELDLDLLREVADFLVLETEAGSKEQHLNSPHLGSRLAAHCEELLHREDCDVQIVVSDGLSAEAVHANIAELFPVLVDGLAGQDLKMGRPVAVRYGRVKLAEQIAQLSGARLTILLIGERPGGDALASRSLSAYLAYQLVDPTAREQAARFSGNQAIRFEYTVISNIYSGGLLPVEAGSVIAEKAWQILERQAAGNRLEKMLKGGA
ncbi:MAG: ethanolamine ammonia-lyase, partial [Planctomycetes bacterium]|nr:ethanolamine ammonia-lyase [Planctomycetota bacterium]